MAKGKRTQSGIPRAEARDPDLQDASRGIRIQKALAAAGVASRRDAEQLVSEGHVRVNGQVVRELPAWVDPSRDHIEVDGQPLARRRPDAQADKPRHLLYIALNKPRHTISTVRDPQGRRTVLDLLPRELLAGQRVFPVGRLDADSTGLILLTNDGQLAQRLTHPRYEVAKRYRVSVRGRLTPEDVEKLKHGLYLADRRQQRRVGAKKAAMSRVRLVGYEQDRTRGDRTTLEVTLREGQNREIRRMLARLDMKVRRLERVAIGPLTVKGLAVGAWRVLRSAEVRALQKAAAADHESA